MRAIASSNYIVEVHLERESVPSFDAFPFSVPSIRELYELEFPKPVTFLVGENGSGKSTIIEALAVASGFSEEGGTRNMDFVERRSQSGLHEYLRLVRSSRRPGDGFFLRAESFYNVATMIDETGATPWYGGKSLHAQSHGEAFLTLLTEKFVGGGLYILDEPEAALSPARQMAMLARMHELVVDASQFIIATHSPILMAYPNATIYLLGEDEPRVVDYEDTEHYIVMRDFMNHRATMLKELMS
jgi:predicted ATPase